VYYFNIIITVIYTNLLKRITNIYRFVMFIAVEKSLIVKSGLKTIGTGLRIIIKGLSVTQTNILYYLYYNLLI